jgi:hypothetical protein
VHLDFLLEIRRNAVRVFFVLFWQDYVLYLVPVSCHHFLFDSAYRHHKALK